MKRYLDNAKKARTRELHVIKGATHNLGEADSPFRMIRLNPRSIRSKGQVGQGVPGEGWI